jgi:hypothetical protein
MPDDTFFANSVQPHRSAAIGLSFDSNDLHDIFV